MNVTQDQILAILHDAGIAADVSHIKSDTRFKDAGVDSIEMFNVFLAIEERYGIKIPDADVGKLDTVDNVVRYLLSR